MMSHQIRIVIALFVFAGNSFAGVLFGPVTNAGNGHVYFLLSSNNWIGAEIQAQHLGGHLATVRNANEQNFIYSTFSHWAGTNRNLWIGLFDHNLNTNSPDRIQRRTEFEWASGEPVTYSNWSPVEPNNPLSNDTSVPELYVHIWNPSDFYASDWNNYTNFSSEFGIEIDGVAEVVLPVPVLQITNLSATQVQVSWFGATNKAYQLLSSTNLFVPLPTDSVAAIGSDGTVSYCPAPQFLYYHGWNITLPVPGNNEVRTFTDTKTQPQTFYQMLTSP